jgi:hypothetical protein
VQIFMPHEFADPAPAQLPDAPADLNPYASPLAQGPLLAEEESEPIGVWRNGDRLIMHRSAVLPARCVRTNAFCDHSERHEFKLNSEFAHQMGRVLTLIAGALLAILVYFFLSGPAAHYTAGMLMALALLIAFLFTLRTGQETQIVYYHSRASRERRAPWLVLGSSLLLLGICLGLITVPDLLFEPLRGFLGGMAGLSVMVGGLLFAFAKLQFRVEPLGDRYFVIHGCGRAFRDSFPECRLRPFSRVPR